MISYFWHLCGTNGSGLIGIVINTISTHIEVLSLIKRKRFSFDALQKFRG